MVILSADLEVPDAESADATNEVAAANDIWYELEREYAELSTNATLQIMPNTSHAIDWEAPHEVADAIIRAESAAQHGNGLEPVECDARFIQ